MDLRSKLPQFHPNSEMECLSKGEVILLSLKKLVTTIFTIHNMTENKINYRLVDCTPELIKNEFNMRDFLKSAKYNVNNIELEPFQVVWLSFLTND